MTPPPLSFTQEQLWFIDEFHHGLPAHNVPSLIWLRGQLDVAALERAISALVARHEPLRTRLVAGTDGHPVQVIDPAGRPAPAAELELTDYATLPAEAAVGQVRKLADGEALRPFHLTDEHPLRTRLARITDDEHVLVLVAHQTVADDWSMRVLLADLTALYRGEVTGQPAGLAELPVRFADYAVWERQHLQGQVLADEEDYWRATLADYETSRFPADRPRPLLADHAGAVAQITVDLALLDRLGKLSRNEGTTLPVTLLAALLVLLHRYTGQADLVAGTVIPHPAGNRARPELARLLAGLDSPLPIRAQASGDVEFRQFLARVREAVTDAQAHQDLPFARIVAALPIDRDPGRFPVFQTAFSYSEPPPDIEAAGVTFSCERIPLPASKYDLGFLAEPRPDGLRLEATYTPALFDAATVSRLLGNFEVLLRGVADDPSARLGRQPVLTEAELRAEIQDWNATKADLPVECIHEGFEAQAARTPDAVAAELADERVSYAELNRQANQVARCLRNLRVGPEALAGVCMPTGLRRLAALLGILKAGAGYVPLDPALPSERLAFMINDTGMTVILTDDRSRASVPDVAGVTVVSLEAEWDQLSQLADDDLKDTGVTPSNVAYVIYTSGSTGQPKGVVVEHRQAINFLHGMVRHWRIGAGGAVLQFAAFTFDVSVMDIFMPLLGGAKVVLAAPETLHSPPRLAALMRDARITFACLPPAVLNLLTGEEFPELRTLLSAGEELASELLRAWLRNGGGTMEFYNGYGPTEASIGSTFMKLEPSTPLPPPIGRPKPNYQAYVLDSYLNPVPVGVTGELHIGGVGVARGYLNRPELTRERFIPDPFIPGQRLYKTGDLVRRRPDGTLEFAGRIDNQVKIRGLRVELGEIETALVAQPDVAQAVVTVVTDSAGVKQLAGYLRAAEGAAIVIADIRRQLARSLPAYMIPTYLVTLDELPLTAHGKIDKAALPPPRSAGDAAADRVPPHTLLEAVLVDLYARLLGSEQVGATESFFDAGGNSLQAMGLIAELRTALAVDLDIATLFLTPTPRQLAAVLRDTHGFADSDLGPDGVDQREAITRLRRQADDTGPIPRRRTGLAEVPLSPGQEQLWLIDRLTPGLANYNIPQVLRLSGVLDHRALERALGGLIGRHEVLRTRLVADGQGRPVQVIGPAGPVVLEVLELAGPEPGEGPGRLRELVLAQALRPFDLAAGPLLRAGLVRLGEAEHALVMVFHHAVFDGWSAGVLRRDLAALYRDEATRERSPEIKPERKEEGLFRETHGSGSTAADPRPVPALAELPVQFADYAVWERDRLRGELLAGLESYWRGVLDGFETVQFPADRPRPVVDCFDGALAERMTDAGLLAGLREVSRREGVTLFVTVMAGLLALLHRYTGQDDLVVGTVSANRGRAELAPVIGFLVNTLPIRCDVSGDPQFRDLLGRVKEVVVGAFAHQDLPFGQLVDALKVRRDASRSPIFQINFTYTERDDTLVHAAGADFLVIDVVRGIDAAKFDLTFAVEARAGGLWLECCYKTALFDAGTIDRLLGHLEVLLRGVAADPCARLSELPLLTEAELRAEIHGWNDTAGQVPPVCVHEGFEAQAARTPDAIAAEFEDELVSYAELNRQANQVARRLRELGLGPEALAGVSMRAGPRRLAAMLGILKAGAGYVPLDPALPAERLAFMINDTGMTVILTDHASADQRPAAGTLNVDAEWDQLSQRPGDDLKDAGVTPSNVAYVIYTSGSTGRPKGVVVEHRNVVNLACGLIEHWGIGPGSVMLQFASFAFDVSVKDMFLSLLSGARLVLAAPETLHSPPRLAALIRQAGVTFASLPPAVLGLLPAGEYPELRVIMAGGDELPAELARRWIRPGLRLVNGYGPTETTVTAAFAELDATTPMPPPIGFPVRPNYQAYVLDRYLNPVPVGVVGELHIGGAGVARGYLNRPVLTGDRFIADPFHPGRRLYKSGDLVRRRPDGSIEFTGRIDNQVKIRGIRIELGEIEAALAAHPAIAQAVVTVVTGPAGNSELAAYLRSDSAGRISEHEIQAHLARTLPAAMIPSHYLTVETFPLNSSGKVDRKALPTPRRQATEDKAEPENPTEALLTSLYATLLGTTGIGATDSFFDLGGNSLTAMRLVNLISRETNADLGVSTIFLHPTPRRLAAAIAAISPSEPLAGSGPLLALNNGTAEFPLFLVHAIGGTVSAYVPLSDELADTFKVYGLESPALSDGVAAASSLAGLVTDYTRRIQAVQPAGPYALAGWSMGGVIAFEIAQRLEQAGADVRLLVLLDAPFAISAEHASGEAGLAARFVADATHSLSLDTAGAPDPAVVPPAGHLAWLAGRLADGSDPAERDVIEARLQRRFGLFAAHSRMLAGYRPAGNPVRAPTLIVSAAGSLNAPARSLWPGQLTGEVSVLSVESDHYDFLRPPLVQDVGAAISRLAGSRS